MGRAGPREVALVYSPASLACIFIMALLWAPRRGSGPASSHSFALHQDSRIISPLTVAGCSCPTPSPVNGAQLSLLSLSLPPTQRLSVPVPKPESDALRDTVSFSCFLNEWSAKAGFTPWLRLLPHPSPLLLTLTPNKEHSLLHNWMFPAQKLTHEVRRACVQTCL